MEKKPSDKKLELHHQTVGLLASRIFKNYVDCLMYTPEPEHFFENAMIKMGYDKDELLMSDTWRAFLFCLFTRSRK